MNKIFYLLFILLTLTITSANAYKGEFKIDTKATEVKWEGVASYYHPKFEGRKTANGEKFSNQLMTAANNFLPLGTIVKVTNIKNHKSVIVKINDRLNKKNKRLIDLTYFAAQKLGLIHQGIGKVCMEIIKMPNFKV